MKNEFWNYNFFSSCLQKKPLEKGVKYEGDSLSNLGRLVIKGLTTIFYLMSLKPLSVFLKKVNMTSSTPSPVSLNLETPGILSNTLLHELLLDILAKWVADLTKQSATLLYDESKPFKVERSVQQGDTISPNLF